MVLRHLRHYHDENHSVGVFENLIEKAEKWVGLYAGHVSNSPNVFLIFNSTIFDKLFEHF